MANLIKGEFIRRDNRFLVTVEVEGREEKAHLRDPGRLQELLVEGRRVLLKKADKARNAKRERKTNYELIAVYDRLPVVVNSGLHSKLAEKLVKPIFGCEILKKEFKYGKGRIDFLLDCDGKKGIRKGIRKSLLEVKGCTLVKKDIAYFPDAPTERGLRHVILLMKAIPEYDAKILFLVMRPDANLLMPNAETHPEFAIALKEAINAGVEARAALLELRVEVKGRYEVGTIYFYFRREIPVVV